MDQKTLETIIRTYIPNIVHMSLATCADNTPWVCEVHFAYDDDLNLYFRSKPDRRHSQEIARNPRVAGNIVVQHALGDAVRGVYFEGTAELLKDVGENHPAYRAYCKRMGTGPAILQEAASSTGHGFYKISVSDYYVFDAIESTPSQKYHLPWAKNQ